MTLFTTTHVVHLCSWNLRQLWLEHCTARVSRPSPAKQFLKSQTPIQLESHYFYVPARNLSCTMQFFGFGLGVEGEAVLSRLTRACRVKPGHDPIPLENHYFWPDPTRGPASGFQVNPGLCSALALMLVTEDPQAMCFSMQHLQRSTVLALLEYRWYGPYWHSCWFKLAVMWGVALQEHSCVSHHLECTHHCPDQWPPKCALEIGMKNRRILNGNIVLPSVGNNSTDKTAGMCSYCFASSKWRFFFLRRWQYFIMLSSPHLDSMVYNAIYQKWFAVLVFCNKSVLKSMLCTYPA